MSRSASHAPLALLKSLVPALALAATLAPAAASAQEAYPQRPITLVVPHPPGGSVDGVARIYAEQLAKELGQSVVVENRAGASGMIGAAYVARAAPDGYTLYLNASIHAINPLLYKKTIKFDAVKDFTPISELAQGALIFSINPKVPANNVQELVKTLKADPQKYSFATTGFGSAGHLAAASFLHENGLSQIPIVLYRGGGPAVGPDRRPGARAVRPDAVLAAHGARRQAARRGGDGRRAQPAAGRRAQHARAGPEELRVLFLVRPVGPGQAAGAGGQEAGSGVGQDHGHAKVVEQLGGLGFEPAVKNSADFSRFINAEMKRYQTIIEQSKIEINE